MLLITRNEFGNQVWFIEAHSIQLSFNFVTIDSLFKLFCLRYFSIAFEVVKLFRNGNFLWKQNSWKAGYEFQLKSIWSSSQGTLKGRFGFKDEHEVKNWTSITKIRNFFLSKKINSFRNHIQLTAWPTWNQPPKIKLEREKSSFTKM